MHSLVATVHHELRITFRHKSNMFLALRVLHETYMYHSLLCIPGDFSRVDLYGRVLEGQSSTQPQLTFVFLVPLHPQRSVADFALGVRFLTSASKGNCAYKGGSNCSVHIVLGTVITTAAVIDYILAHTLIHGIEQLCIKLDVVTRKVRLGNAHAACQAYMLWFF
jgi:hypothetical protein